MHAEIYGLQQLLLIVAEADVADTVSVDILSAP